jgi:hypothetical protein
MWPQPCRYANRAKNIQNKPRINEVCGHTGLGMFCYTDSHAGRTQPEELYDWAQEATSATCSSLMLSRHHMLLRAVVQGDKHPRVHCLKLC